MRWWKPTALLMRKARPLAFGPLPPAMNGLTQQVKAFERLTIEAAVHGCRESALLALVTNPLVGNVTDARRCWMKY